MKIDKKLAFGCMRLPLDDSGTRGINIGELMRMTDLFLSRGFRYFDAAYTYCDGLCEAALRRALVERYPRGSYILADKLPTMLVGHPDEQEEIFAAQLQNCGVEYFDRYIIHCATAAFYERAEALGSFAFAEKVRTEGRAAAVGFSTHDTPELLDAILTRHPSMDFVQLQINYADWTRTPLRARECYETARRHGKPVTVMGALKGGLLADVPLAVERLLQSVSGNPDPAVWALRFAASLDGVDYVLSGMSSYGEMERNTRAMADAEKFSAAEYAVVDEVADAVCGSTPVQCTSCGYCVDACPQNIAIPECLHLYNSYSRMFGARNYDDEYTALTDGRGRASQCSGCRQCEGRCPQRIGIADWIGRVADAFEYRGAVVRA